MNEAMTNLNSVLTPHEIESALNLVIQRLEDGVAYLQVTEHYELMATTNKNYGGGGAGIYLLFNRFGLGKGTSLKSQKIRPL